MNYFYSVFRLSTNSDLIFAKLYIPFLIFGLGGIFNLILIPFGLDPKNTITLSLVLTLLYSLFHYFSSGFKLIKEVSNYSIAKIYFLSLAFLMCAILVEFGSVFIVVYSHNFFLKKW